MKEHARAARGGDLWGGLAAMLVALPSAIAFGVTIYAPLGAGYAAQGALAGILGATAIGIVAPLFGGTKRLISAPCAPAAAVLAAFAIELSADGVAAPTVLVLLAIVALACGVLQLVFGWVGLGRLIKYMPYPVVSGYLSGVGLVIVVSQVPKLLGVPEGTAFTTALVEPSLWSGVGVAVGVATIAVMLAAPLFTRIVPAAILALAAGVAAYFMLAFFDGARLRCHRGGDRGGEDGGPHCGLRCGYSARHLAFRTRADRRLGGAQQKLWKPPVRAPDPRREGDGRTRAARRADRYLRVAGQFVLWHHRSAL